MDDYYLDLNGRNLAEENPVYLTSGADSDPFPLVGLYDADNQIVGSWSDATLKISFSDSSVIKETSTTFTAIEGYFPLYPLRLIYAPGQSVDATLTTSISIVSGGQTKVIPITLITKASFRNCSRGERLTDSRECYACDPGQYILARDSIGVCQGCPDHLKCFGGDDIGPEAGYWRFDGWKVTALKCLNAGACLGHTVDPNKQGVSCKEQRDPAFCYTGFCQKGYEGNLCSSCIDGYALSGGTFCVPCTNNPMFYVVLVIVVIVAIFFIIFTVRNALKVKEATKLNKPKTSILIKIFLNYVQLVSIVGSFQFQWPDQIQQMFKVQDKVATGPSEAFSVDCLLPGQSADSRTFFMKLLLISVSPLVLIVCGTIVWAIIFWLKKAAFDRLFKSNLTTTFVVLLFMLHSTLVQNSIIAFRCQNIGDTESGNQEYYLERDLQVQCWGRQHMLWIFICALPAFLIWGIGTPVFAFFVLKRNLHKLENIEFKSKYGFLYDGYKKQKYYWEFVILYRKIAMIFISVFMVTVGIKIQSLCVLGVCFLCYLLQIYGVPFEDQNLNYMERRALINATVTLYCGIYYVTGDLPQWVNWLLLVVILALNIWFFVIWFKSLVLEFLKERKAAKAQQELEKKAKKEAQEGKVQDGDEIQKLEVDGESPKKQKTLGKEKKPFLSYFKKKKKDNPIRINQA